MLKYLKDTLTRNNLLPKHKGIYAVIRGTYSGEYFVYMGPDNDNFKFYSIVDKKTHCMSLDVFQRGIKNNILDFVQILPHKVFDIVEKEFNAINNKNGLRRT